MSGVQSNIQWYVSRFSQYPLLTGEQEIDLGQRLREQDHLLASLRSPYEGTSSTAREQQVSAAERERKMLRDAFTNANLRLAFAVAKKEWNRFGRRENLEDLVQNANVGLMQAVDRYDPSRGIRFSTYATAWILNGIWTGRSHSGLVYIPSEQYTKQDAIVTFSLSYHEEHGHFPTNQEIANGLGWKIPSHEIDQILRDRCMRHGISLDQPLDTHDHDSVSRVDLVPSKEEVVYGNLEVELLDRGLPKLTGFQRQILDLHYHSGHDFPSIAQELHTSTKRIKEHHNLAVQILKHFATTYRGDSDEDVRNAMYSRREAFTGMEWDTLVASYELGMAVPDIAEYVGTSEYIVQRRLLSGVWKVHRMISADNVPYEKAAAPLYTIQTDDDTMGEGFPIFHLDDEDALLARAV